MLDLRPKLVAASQRLQEPINQCDVVADMDAVRRKVTMIHNIKLLYGNVLNHSLMYLGTYKAHSVLQIFAFKYLAVSFSI